MEGPVFSADLELRAAGDGSRRLSGRFPYGARATMDAGGNGRRPRKESFAARAFSFAVDDPDREVHFLIGHSFDRPLASRKAGTLKLKDGDDALRFEAIIVPEIQRTSWASDFLNAFAAGLIAGLSPGFRVPPSDVVPGAERTEQEPAGEGNALVRIIAAAVLFELSAVVRPAYHETELDMRAAIHGAAAVSRPAAHAGGPYRWR